jgi:CubicO group peptidase (beta-lactamase class C family)
MKAFDVPGFAVAVVKDGQIVALDAFGVRDLQGHPATSDTIYYIASATKPFTAMGLCILADEGKIDLDAPVKKYLPSLQLPSEALTERMTVRDLLCHRFGISCREIVQRDAYTGQITDDLYFALLKNAEVAGQVDYSNIHFTLAGRVIEAVSGQKWQDFLKQRIFDPADMSRTTAYASTMYGDADAAMPMIMLEGEWMQSPLLKTDRTMHAAGGMGTCARDAARWLILNMNGGEVDGKRIVSQRLADEMLTQQAALPNPRGAIRIETGFGLGWQCGAYRDAEHPYRLHGGGYVGASTYFAFLPEHKIGVAVLVNTDRGGGGMCDIVSIDVLDRLLGFEDTQDLLPDYKEHAAEMRRDVRTHKPPGVNPASAPSGLSLAPEKYLGRFANDAVGEMDVFLNDHEELCMRIGDLPIRLFSAGRDAFNGWSAPGMISSGAFVVGADGSVTAVILELDEDGPVRLDRVSAQKPR